MKTLPVNVVAGITASHDSMASGVLHEVSLVHVNLVLGYAEQHNLSLTRKRGALIGAPPYPPA